MINCLAFDLGATSGRLILGKLNQNKIELEEIYRFPNGFLNINGHSYWNIFQLYSEMKKGLEIFAKTSQTAHSMAIDTWGVDFVLLGNDGAALGLPFAYRDNRYNDVLNDFEKNVMPLEELYSKTGLQMLQFNTIFQLYSLNRDRVPVIQLADSFLFVPDFLSYLFCGVKKNEFTIASTSQLLDPIKREYNSGLIRLTGVEPGIFQELVMPGTILANLKETICNETGMSSIPVVAVGSHDTASAIAATPAIGDDWAYLSSGTWSIMGIESNEAIINSSTFQNDFTNEGGVEGTYRFLKNIKGLWLLEQCKAIWALEGNNYTYDQLVAMALKTPPFKHVIDIDHHTLMNPSNMVEAIKKLCVNTGQTEPTEHADLVRLIYDSLAFKYKYVFNKLKELSPRPIHKLHVIGGGSKNALLCQLTADALGVPVVAGPSEATAVGNILIQAKALGIVNSLKEIRQIIVNSFELPVYEPISSQVWNNEFVNYLNITGMK